MRYWLLIALAACATPGPDRGKELAACQLISDSGDALARCLIMKYSWGADSARPAKYRWQGYLDSLRLEHESQVAALIAEQDRQRDSELSAATVARGARQRFLDQRSTQIDSTFNKCLDAGFAAASHTTGGFDYSQYQPRRIRCESERKDARHRVGLATTEEP